LTSERTFGILRGVSRTQVRRRRGVLLVSGLAIAIGFLGARASAGPATSATPIVSKVVVVHRGDTVWGIARQIVGVQGDPRPMVQGLIHANHLHGGLITLGERLVVPAR
jgi:nucleoid-associated protein YgaU